MEKNVYQLVKEVFLNTEKIPAYPELALYNEFIKLNADHWFSPKDCRVSECCNFGRSVRPNICDEKIHSGLTLIEYRDGLKHGQSNYLTHQIYLHDLLMKIWRGEAYNYEVSLEILCIRKSDEKVKIF